MEKTYHRSLVEDEIDRLGMYAPRQRGVESTSTNRPCHSHTSTGVPHSGWVQAVAGSHAYTVLLEYSSRIEPDRHRRLHKESRFEPESRHKGGQSGGETPVPIPNTEVKSSIDLCRTAFRRNAQDVAGLFLSILSPTCLILQSNSRLLPEFIRLITGVFMEYSVD